MRRTFREAFESYAGAVNWFPGHMASASRRLEAKLPKCDVVVEVRDARLPLSSAPHHLEALLGTRRRVVVFNKMDLANPRVQPAVVAALAREGVESHFVSADSRPSLARLRQALLRHVRSEYRVAGTVVAIVGVPNVGKSSLINGLREVSGSATSSSGASRHRGVKTGATPGLTRHISAHLVNAQPPLYLLDSPGILPPHIPDVEVGLRLALCATIRDAAVPHIALADYLLFLLNQRGSERYVEALGLDGPSDDPVRVLDSVAARVGARRAGGDLDREAASRHLLRLFRDGSLGRFTLDDVSDWVSQWTHEHAATEKAMKDKPGTAREKATAAAVPSSAEAGPRPSTVPIERS